MHMLQPDLIFWNKNLPIVKLAKVKCLNSRLLRLKSRKQISSFWNLIRHLFKANCTDWKKKIHKLKMPMENVDKGWSWVVLVTMLFCNILVTINSLSTNIYYVIFLSVFGESRALTAWYGAFYYTTLFLSG